MGHRPSALAASATVVAQHSYDGSDCGATLTQPSQLPWIFAYGQAGNATTADSKVPLSASRLRNRGPARRHTANVYDDGRPTEGTATINHSSHPAKVGAYVNGHPSNADAHTPDTGCNQVKAVPTSAVTDPDRLALITATPYDSQGQVIKITLPKPC